MEHFATIFAAQVDYVATLRVVRTHFKNVAVEGHEMRWTKLNALTPHGEGIITTTDHRHPVEMLDRIEKAQKRVALFAGTPQAMHRVIEQLRHCQWIVDFSCEAAKDGSQPWEAVIAVARRLHSLIITPASVTDSRNQPLLKLDAPVPAEAADVTAATAGVR